MFISAVNSTFVSESLLQFFKTNPFWAAIIIIFAILPIIGAVVHIILKALGRRGIDSLLSNSETTEAEQAATACRMENRPARTIKRSKDCG
jgi:hypothetical protein